MWSRGAARSFDPVHPATAQARWESWRATVAPARMADDFPVPFIRRVERVKKSFRVSDVHRHRNTQPAALGPNRIETRVVNGDQLPGSIPDVQSEVLKHLQAPRTTLHRFAELLRH